jgi:hypothetical protein
MIEGLVNNGLERMGKKDPLNNLMYYPEICQGIPRRINDKSERPVPESRFEPKRSQTRLLDTRKGVVYDRGWGVLH